ncbi:unnamed protein product [marine sediment metagenome]|uniref:Uncharacterized protein n=1 Tax=marine sediment metagenome TaxID=412755 RepID=X0VJ95_9ZZZZ
MLAAIVGPFYLIYGLSILLYVKQWKKVVAAFEQNHFIMMPLAFFGLVIGLILINMYNVWEWSIYVVITLTGWIVLIKSAFYLLAPGAWIKTVLRHKWLKMDSYFYFWGAALLIIGAWLSYNAYIM